MSIDMLSACFSSSATSPPFGAVSVSALFNQLSAQLAAAAQSTTTSSASMPSPSFASSFSTPSSPPPGRVYSTHHHHRNGNNNRKSDADSAAAAEEFRFVQNAMAMAVLARLHRWCCQLFWLTIVCLIGYCSDNNNSQQNGEGKQQQQRQTRTFQEVRKSIVQANQRRGCKTLQELEMQLLRHLTCPQTAVLRPLRPFQHKKRHFLSRPPSPQLFDIREEME